MANVWLGYFGRPVLLLLLGLLAGVVAEWLLLRLLRLLVNPRWPGREVLIAGLRGAVTSWFVLAATFVALLTLKLSAQALDLAVQVLTVVFVLSLTLTAARIISGLVELYTEREGAALPSASIIINLTRLLVLLVGGLIILRALNLDITPILTTLGVGALAVALALQDTLSNLFAGLQIVAARQLRPGDYVRLDSSQEGYIEDIDWRTTTLRQLSGAMVIVPNAKLSQAIVINHDLRTRDVAVAVELSVSYYSDLERVEAVTLAVAREVMQLPGGVASHEPSLSFSRMAEYSVSLSVFMRAASFVDQFKVRHEFIRRLIPRYNAEGIVIPLPIQIEIPYDSWQERYSSEKQRSQ